MILQVARLQFIEYDVIQLKDIKLQFVCLVIGNKQYDKCHSPHRVLLTRSCILPNP